jgi:hypothetical protein
MMAFLRFFVFCKHLCARLGGIRDRSFEPQREFLFQLLASFFYFIFARSAFAIL